MAPSETKSYEGSCYVHSEFCSGPYQSKYTVYCDSPCMCWRLQSKDHRETSKHFWVLQSLFEGPSLPLYGNFKRLNDIYIVVGIHPDNFSP